jgi:hypothetical protein
MMQWRRTVHAPTGSRLSRGMAAVETVVGDDDGRTTVALLMADLRPKFTIQTSSTTACMSALRFSLLPLSGAGGVAEVDRDAAGQVSSTWRAISVPRSHGSDFRIGYGRLILR